MTLVSEQKLNIVWTERGRSIEGTRITLYDVMTYLKANRSCYQIAQKLGITIEQIDAAIAYMPGHRTRYSSILG
jgi:uncharacterized protein (DUF433 family)